MAGLSCSKEVRRIILQFGKRSDVEILGALRTITTDVRTVVDADPQYCAAAALFTGHGAVWGPARKNEVWLRQTLPQGDASFALCQETGGHMGDAAHDFIGMRRAAPGCCVAKAGHQL